MTAAATPQNGPDLTAYRGTCRSCGAPILWAVTARGEAMPVDQEPHGRGNVLLSSHSGQLYAGVLGRTSAAGARAADTDLYRSHFATCPQAATHRRHH